LEVVFLIACVPGKPKNLSPNLLEGKMKKELPEGVRMKPPGDLYPFGGFFIFAILKGKDMRM
jgi:hypothetical protein